MLPIFLSFIESKQLIADSSKATLLAVSGGVDSIVLCHLFKQANLPFAIAHCNFNLRGAEANGETQFVKDLAQFYQAPFYSTRFKTKAFAVTHKISTQMAARTLRYEFFYKLLEEHQLNQIATAHHWDDSVETILFNFIKGTGILGFQGIQPMHEKTIRPLLFARKKEIIDYAQKEGLHWQEDSSNKADCYQRNFIRNKIIPLLHQINPNFEETTKATCAKLTDVGHIFQKQIQKIKTEIISFKDGIYHVAIEEIAHFPEAVTIAFELLRPYGFTFEQIKKLINHPIISGKVIYSADYTLYIDRKQWLITKKDQGDPLQLKCSQDQKEDHTIMVADTQPFINYNSHRLYFQIFERQNYVIPQKPTIAALDYATLQFPLIIRPWQSGDVFYPLGMHGRKKVSDLLIDLKVPMAIKKKVLVVTSNGQIVWVVGYRIDERFKVRMGTKKIFEIQLALKVMYCF